MLLIFSFSISYGANGNEEFLKANEYYEKNDYSNAEKMFLESIKKGNVRANYNLATIYLNKKEYSKAEKYFLDALKKNNGDPELEKSTLFNLSRLYQITNQNDKAEKYLKMSSKSTNDVSAEIELGTTYFYQKKYDLAEKAYVSALNKIKDKKELSDNVKINLAATYREQKKYKEAENTLLSMNDKNSKNSIRAFGILYWKQNNKRKAVEYFKKALDNGDEEMLSNVVKLYGELDEDDKIEEVLRN
jgi:tetratricopeptide repeat protein